MRGFRVAAAHLTALWQAFREASVCLSTSSDSVNACEVGALLPKLFVAFFLLSSSSSLARSLAFVSPPSTLLALSSRRHRSCCCCNIDWMKRIRIMNEQPHQASLANERYFCELGVAHLLLLTCCVVFIVKLVAIERTTRMNWTTVNCECLSCCSYTTASLLAWLINTLLNFISFQMTRVVKTG